MIYLRTDKDQIIREIVTDGVSPIATDGGVVYIVEAESIPDEVIPDLSSYMYDGAKFIKLDPLSVKQLHINEYRTAKIQTMSNICNTMIISGIDYGDSHYSLKTDDQINISRLGLEAQRSEHPALIYHGDGEPVRIYTEEEMIAISDKANVWITYNTTYYNLLKQYIENSTSVDSFININYFDPLPTSYMEELERMVDISAYEDFSILPVIDTNDYSYINPKLDATICIEEYKEKQKKEWMERVQQSQ